MGPDWSFCFRNGRPLSCSASCSDFGVRDVSLVEPVLCQTQEQIPEREHFFLIARSADDAEHGRSTIIAV